MNTEDKIAELTAEIDRLGLVLAERQAKIGQLMGEAARAEIAGASVQGAGEVPEDVRYALDRMCLPLDASRLSGVTAAEDARCMAVIKEYIERASAPAALSEQAEKLMADMDTMRDEYASLSNALAFWLPTVPEQAGAIQDRIVHDVFFLGEHGEPKSAQDLGWITLNIGQSAALAAPLREQTGLSEAQKEAMRDALSAELGDAMDCTRRWSAWGSGTMHQDDFKLLADNDERLDDLVGVVVTALSAASPSPAPAQQQEPNNWRRIAKESAHHLEVWLEQDDCDCEGGHTCGKPLVQATLHDLKEVLSAAESSASVETATPGASIGDKQ